MWTIIKLNPKKFELLKNDFSKNLVAKLFFIDPKLNSIKIKIKRLCTFYQNM